MTPNKAERIIESLRKGIPPEGQISYFTVGRETEINKLTTRLNKKKSGALLLKANYGSGKTHLLKFIREIALQQGFAVSTVTIIQQFLSLIASDRGRFTRVAELCKLTEHKDYIQRVSVDSILSELANKEYLKPHGFKYQFGGNENLYKLQDYRMIYGNFPAGSHNVEVHYKSKHLGTVPAVNLLRLRIGDRVNFAGKRWQIRKASIDGFYVEPSESGGAINTNFIYPGAGMGFDSFLAGKMWELLHGMNFPDIVLSSFLRDLVNFNRTKLLNLCDFEQIPFIRSQEGICYFTFAGYLTNKAVSLISKQAFYKANDISVLVNSPIDWKKIPIGPEEYRSVFHLLFEASSNQSIYQNLLPPEFQTQEYIQEWLKDESIKQALRRLANSSVINVSQSDCGFLKSL